jgi:hypothetical protein
VDSISNTINFILLLASIALLILGAVWGRVLGKLSHRWVVGLWSFGIALLFFSIASFILVSIGNKFYTQISIAIGTICGFSTYILVRDRDLTIDDLELTHKIREPYLAQILPLFGDMQTYLQNLSANTELSPKITEEQLDSMINVVMKRLGGWRKMIDSSMEGQVKYGLILGAAMEAIGIIPLDNQLEWRNEKHKLQQLRAYIPDKKLNQLIRGHLILLEGMYYSYIFGRYVDMHNIDKIDVNKKIAAIVANRGRDELLSESLVRIARRIEELRIGKKAI